MTNGTVLIKGRPILNVNVNEAEKSSVIMNKRPGTLIVLLVVVAVVLTLLSTMK